MANGKDIVKHIERYEKKLGVSFFDEWDLGEYPFVCLFPDGSFFTYGVQFDSLMIGPSSGSLRMFKAVAIAIARVSGLKRIVTNTTRDMSAYERISGGICYKVTRENGVPVYYFEMEVS